jgi:hypothetical protein
VKTPFGLSPSVASASAKAVGRELGVYRRNASMNCSTIWSRQEEPADTCCGNGRLFERQIMTRSGNDLER